MAYFVGVRRCRSQATCFLEGNASVLAVGMIEIFSTHEQAPARHPLSVGPPQVGDGQRHFAGAQR